MIVGELGDEIKDLKNMEIEDIKTFITSVFE